MNTDTELLRIVRRYGEAYLDRQNMEKVHESAEDIAAGLEAERRAHAKLLAVFEAEDHLEYILADNVVC